MANMDIRLEARGAGVPFWRISQKLGVSEPTMTRKLRTELSAVDKAAIRSIIAELKAGA